MQGQVCGLSIRLIEYHRTKQGGRDFSPVLPVPEPKSADLNAEEGEKDIRSGDQDGDKNKLHLGGEAFLYRVHQLHKRVPRPAAQYL